MRRIHRTHFLLLIATMATLAGCAVEAKQVAFQAEGPPEQSILCEDAKQVTLAIAPIIDQRPVVEKEGETAKGMYLLVYNQRSGRYVSADKDFKGDIHKAMTSTIARYIEKSNCFGDVKILEKPLNAQLGQEDLTLLLAKQNVDYVLIPELKHFFGEQSQNANLLIVPAHFVNAVGWNNEIGKAIGYTEMLATLYDTQVGHEVWREKILGNGQSVEEGAYPEVARDSFIVATKDLTHKLFNFANRHLNS